MTKTQLSQYVVKQEGLKQQISIAQVKEVLRILSDLASHSPKALECLYVGAKRPVQVAATGLSDLKSSVAKRRAGGS